MAQVPPETRALLLEEVDALREMYRSGDRGRARHRAREAAVLFVAAFGPGSDQERIDPRAAARKALGEEPLAPSDRPEPLSGGGEPTAPSVETDPRKLAKQIGERGGR